MSGTSGINDTHVFAICGEDVTLPYKGTLSDCNATEWFYNRHGGQFKLLPRGNMDNGGRQSLASDCSLNINNITEEDYGIYTGFVTKNYYAYVFLHVLYGQYFLFLHNMNLKPTFMFHFCFLFQFHHYPRILRSDQAAR